MRPTISQVAALFIPAAIVVAVTCGLAYRSEEARIAGQVIDQSAESLRLVRAQFLSRLALIASDTRFLARGQALTSYLAQHSDASRRNVESDWGAFAESRGIYDQIRFIDASGEERVRINFTGGAAAPVPSEALQSKADRYYFRDSIGLAPGTLYTSRLDLNIENGQVERPFKPMMRVGTPVNGPGGERAGVVVLNYLGHDVMSRFEQTGRGRLWWVDTDGNWLRGPSPDSDWGFMFGNAEATIQAAFPRAWMQMRQTGAGQFEDDAGTWIFDTIHPAAALRGQADPSGEAVAVAPEFWLLIAHVSHADLRAALRQSQVVYLVITLILLGLSFAAAYRTASAMSAEGESRRTLEKLNRLLEDRVAERTRELAAEVETRRSSEELLAHQASHDTLTGLANRDEAERWFATHANRDGQVRGLAMVFIDIDDFKLVNDHLGHANGDKLLRLLAKRYGRNVREGDLLARYGGDEFLLLMNTASNREGLNSALERLARVFDDPFHLDDFEVTVTASLGVARFPEDARDWEGLLKAADTALYEAKRSGKGRLHFYSAHLAEDVKGRFDLTTEMRAALGAGEIGVAFQPKIDGSGAITGFEALARWHSPRLGQVPPDRFIAIAEETGMILDLGRQILLQACREAVRWQRETGRLLTVAVNLSPRQIRDELVGEVQDALAESGLPPHSLELEVTENLLMQNMERTVGVLAALRGLGIAVLVDDFGTGYSSLSYLRDLPIDGLKIDKSFITDCQLEGPHMAIPHAVIFLGKSLKLRIVAEGVEAASQFEVLRRCGCDEFQGYWISRPLPSGPALDYAGSGFHPVDWPGDWYLQ
ncbi:MAG: EAL domain-containing protein [Zoogloeaceae bacterium]|nr:EAL domain-containing protein [Zoogloeaceae bacterium]